MKKYLIIPLLIIILFADTLKAETIKIATQKDYYPYSFVDSIGLFNGILIDWWELWGVKAGVEVEFIAGTTNACIDMVLNGQADVVSGLFFEEGDQLGIEYGESIISLNTALYLRKGYKPKSIDDIDRPIGIIRNELSHKNLQDKYPELDLEYVETFEDLYKLVQGKDIPGFIYDFPFPILDYKTFSGAKGYDEYMVIRSDRIRPGVKAGNSEMLNLVLNASVKISTDEIIGILEDYDLFKDPFPYEWVVPVLVFLLLMTSLGYIRLFRRQKKLMNTQDQVDERRIKKVIDQGENDRVEFKSSLRWDYKQNQMNKSLEHVIMKTISAFLNTDGGMLIIGIEDSGGVLGLENDYNTVSKKSRDGFVLTLTNLVNQHIGKHVHKFIDIQIVSIHGKDICVVRTEKSDVPVFLGKNDNEAFFIRASASTQRLSVSEVVGYIKSHWG
jgi:ABC-type amino acid transport substrate-binding protein